MFRCWILAHSVACLIELGDLSRMNPNFLSHFPKWHSLINTNSLLGFFKVLLFFNSCFFPSISLPAFCSVHFASPSWSIYGRFSRVELFRTQKAQGCISGRLLLDSGRLQHIIIWLSQSLGVSSIGITLSLWVVRREEIRRLEFWFEFFDVEFIGLGLVLNKCLHFLWSIQS